MEDMSTLELLSEVQQFADIHEFAEDDDLDRAMALVVKLIAKPEVPAGHAAKVIVELQALSAKFALLATYYQGIGKTKSDAAHKKNLYYTLRDACSKLSDAVKYTQKAVY